MLPIVTRINQVKEGVTRMKIDLHKLVLLMQTQFFIQFGKFLKGRQCFEETFKISLFSLFKLYLIKLLSVFSTAL